MFSFESCDRVWFLTWTTYGTWLPGDARGFVSPKFECEKMERRNNIVGVPYDKGRPALRRLAQSKLVGDPIFLTEEQAGIVRDQFEATATHRKWVLAAGAVMNNHVHLVVGAAGDPDPAYLLRDFKRYASRALNQRFGKPASGTWWTEQGSKRKVKTPRHFEAVVNYVMRQAKPLTVWNHRY